MATAEADVPAILAAPPVLFFGCLLTGWGLGFLWPFEPLAIGFAARLVWGSALFLGALALAIPALVLMRRFHTPAEPWRPTTCIVTAGPYRFTRNPIYVALLLVLAGLAVLTASGWLLLLLPILFVLLNYAVVLAEERYLAHKFGEVYLEYQRAVRRWI